MIIPAYSLTATERVLPRLALDFTTGILDPRVTVSRSLNTATRVNDSGYIEIVNADLPRFDYDPVTLLPRGLLIEESRSNLLLYSQQLDAVVWVKSGLNVTGTPAYIDVAVSPDGTQNADKMIEDTANSQHNVRVSASLAATTAHTYSFYAKAAGRTDFTVSRFNSAVVPSFSHSFNLSAVTSSGGTIVNAGNGWYRCSGSFTTTGAGVGGFVVNMSDGSSTTYQGDGTSGILIWGAQLEAGAFATSYIPTTTTSLTRNADVVSMTGTNFSSWFNVGSGTLMCQASQPTIFAASRSAVSLNSGASNRITLYRQSAGPINGYLAPPGVAATASQNATANTSWKSALAFGATTASYAANSVLAATGYSHTVNFAALNELNIGNASSVSAEWFCGHIQAVRYYPQRLTDAEIRAITK